MLDTRPEALEERERLGALEVLEALAGTHLAALVVQAARTWSAALEVLKELAGQTFLEALEALAVQVAEGNLLLRAPTLRASGNCAGARTASSPR